MTSPRGGRRGCRGRNGYGCTRPDERVLAAFGLLNGAPTRFESCRDVPFGGVLCALPALAENGLFRHIHDCLKKLSGYYTTLHVIVLLAHMALCRIKTIEQLQYQAPGEFGKLLGLDRVPEVRCLRHKLAALSMADGPEKWAGVLSRDWLVDKMCGRDKQIFAHMDGKLEAARSRRKAVSAQQRLVGSRRAMQLSASPNGSTMADGLGEG